MEKDTVVLTLAEYNRLRDLDEITKKDAVVMITTVDHTGVCKEYMSKTDVLSELAKEIEKNKERCRRIEDNFTKLWNEKVLEIKSMNIIEFLWWKKNSK